MSDALEDLARANKLVIGNLDLRMYRIQRRATSDSTAVEGEMALHFRRVGPATEELEIWSASEQGFSFVISNESSGGPGLRGKPGFVASWRPIHINKPAIKVGGSPFKTYAEAESACETMLAYLTR